MKKIEELMKETIWEKGKLTIIGAKTLGGKTQLAVNETLKAAETGKNVLYLSMIKKKEDIMSRLVFFKLGKRFDYLIIKEEDKEIYNDTVKSIENLPIEIYDCSDLSVSDIETLVRVLNNDKKIDLVIVDPLHAINISNSDVPTRKDKFINVVETLKEISKNKDLGVILTAQIKRDNLGDDDLFEGKEIASISDKYFAIERENLIR